MRLVKGFPHEEFPLKRHHLARSHLRSSAFMCGCICLSLNAAAAVTATDAWVRGTVPAQKTTGAFVTLESSGAAKVVGVRSPAAKTAEIHLSEQRGGVMHMHAVDALALPAGKRVELKPGGYHVMLMGLTRPLAAGEQVPLTFTIEDPQGRRTQLEVRAEVRPLGR
jgi:copper(I)-binding protein